METPKKMSLMQLTVLVAVNMMGSGIIMLPTNMAQVGAISLLSWGVTAVGSMAIAYAFAQCGLFNSRPGGMSAYAEDAYGKPGYFMVFLLYFFSLAIGNVAIAISAVGYLATFMPGMSATPIATCISVIGLLWLTTVCNFGGPSVTGKIGSITVWGVIIPVAGLSVIGWFWFKSDVFSAAWNPQGMSLGAGVGSSISLTLWAFLGMESAAQNSNAVENPKKNVPLACLFGTLGAAVVYILSTTVIQGIVPNPELAKSTGPFGLAYAHMFNPTIGSIVMGLAILACLGSLLGWQFTISQTAKAAADDRLFPTFFSRINKMGAPVIGMVVMGVVQSALALSTISPSLSKQFSALVNLAVVTNVVPYIISLSALIVMMKKAGVADSLYKRNVALSLVATLYSTYAIYASGKDAVLGGMIIVALTYITYGFLAPRFATTQSAAGATVRASVVAPLAVAGLLLMLTLLPAAPVSAGTVIERIKESGRLNLGYGEERPFSYKDESGKPAGYAIALCDKIADNLKSELAVPSLSINYVSVTRKDGIPAVAAGKIDILCDAVVPSLAARKEVSFSIPIFSSGVGALIRSDASDRLKDVLSGRVPANSPVWRGNADVLLRQSTLSVVPGTRAERALSARIGELQIIPKLLPVSDNAEGVAAVLEGRSNVFFAERATLLDAVKRRGSPDLQVLDRLFTQETLALAVSRGDEEFRLAVDSALSGLYRSSDFRDVYSKSFGGMNDSALSLFRAEAPPE